MLETGASHLPLKTWHSLKSHLGCRHWHTWASAHWHLFLILLSFQRQERGCWCWCCCCPNASMCYSSRMLPQGPASTKHSILCCLPYYWRGRLWGPFEDILGYCFPAYVGSITTSNPSGLLNNISKAIKASFQEDASGSAESGWESQPNYFQLVVNCRKVDFTSLELQLPLIKSRLCWRRWGKMKQLNLSSIKLLCIPQHRVLLLSRGVIKMNWLNYNLIDWRAPVHCTKAEIPLTAVLSLGHKVPALMPEPSDRCSQSIRCWLCSGTSKGQWQAVLPSKDAQISALTPASPHITKGTLRMWLTLSTL